MRAYLLANDGGVLAERAKPWGIMHVPDGDFAGALRAISHDWLERSPRLPLIAAGMIGSVQGWREVPYRSCPARLADLTAGMLAFPALQRARLHVVPGVVKPGAMPDVMRGEETQIIGALERLPEMGAGARLVMPGTHCKWVEVQGDAIRSFTTYMTGELFAVLREHSILGRPAREAASHSAAAASGSGNGTSWESFDHGVIAARDFGPGLLFSARTLVLTGQLRPQDSLDYLSGLLIGEELRCALRQGAPRDDRPLALIGEPSLCERYRRALETFGIPDVPTIEGTSIAGLWRIAVAAGLVPGDAAPSGGEGGS